MRETWIVLHQTKNKMIIGQFYAIHHQRKRIIYQNMSVFENQFLRTTQKRRATLPSVAYWHTDIYSTYSIA